MIHPSEKSIKLPAISIVALLLGLLFLLVDMGVILPGSIQGISANAALQIASPTTAAASFTPPHRIGTFTLALTDETGAPCADAQVSYQQISHDFLFGTGMATPSEILPFSFFEELLGWGINLLQPFASWAWLEPEDDRYDFVSADNAYYISRLNKMGVTLQLTVFQNQDAPWNIPDYIKTLTPDELIAETREHTEAIVKHYRGVFKYYWFSEPTWQFCDPGEPLCMTHDQWFEMMRAVSEAVHQNDPEAQLMIILIPNDHPEIDYYPFQILDRLQTEGIRFDAIGIEVYPFFADVLDENGYPDIEWLSERLDAFAEYGVPVMLNEIGVPDTPSQETQAEWMRQVYSLALSKPYVIGAVWLFLVDHLDFLPGAGLYPNLDQPPRLIYKTYAEIIAKHTSQGTAVSDRTESVTFTGFAGDYRIQVTCRDRSLTLTEHISGGETVLRQVTLPSPTPSPSPSPTITPSPMPTVTLLPTVDQSTPIAMEGAFADRPLLLILLVGLAVIAVSLLTVRRARRLKARRPH